MAGTPGRGIIANRAKYLDVPEGNKSSMKELLGHGFFEATHVEGSLAPRSDKGRHCQVNVDGRCA